MLVDEEMREAGDSRLVSGLASFLLILTNHTLYYRCKSNIRLARLCMSVHVSSSSSSLVSYAGVEESRSTSISFIRVL